MARNRGIAVRLATWILAGVAVIFTVIFAYSYVISRNIILRNVETNAENLALSTVNRIDSVMKAVEKVPKNLAIFLEDFPYQYGDILRQIRAVVEKNPEIYGATIAFEPYAYSMNIRNFAPYFYKNRGELSFTYIPYEYFYWDWYQIPKELNAPAWSEPYFDEGAGQTMMATFSVPFYRAISGEKRLAGIVTADISLDWLQEMIGSVRIAETGYGFLISKNGTFVTHPSSSLVMNETLFTVAEERGDRAMREVGRCMVRGESGFVLFPSLHTGKQCWMWYSPLPSNQWSLGVLFPKDELMADIHSLNRTIVWLSLAGFVLLLVMIFWISGSITRPLRALSRTARQMATGDLEIPIPDVKTKDEVGTLAASFNSMKNSLKQYISDLKETTAAKERIESELKIAHDIQMSILPKIFPPFPDRTEFDVFASMKPAKEVGGDLYDFFFMDEENFCFAIGDVSGKGVPASLFMAVTKTLVKTKATQGLSAENVMIRVNQDLSLDNESMMFVTLFFGILNTVTGEVVYSNAGHNPPFLLSAAGTITPLQSTGGIALGVAEDCVYRSRKITMQKGDALFLYTDGVTEAMDGREELFSEGRLMQDLAPLSGRSLKEIISGIMGNVEHFSEGVPQADDITMMVIRYFGDKGTNSR
ncbi:MAG: serine/threonine protein phosphatase [Deltaproteobacteria bacterium HGW-Deltaproteobacteria-15]|jgi:sigma-B regulation protein RsbU (phosphoserine phosphatase)|nr:MAG: serine/threonine protein phosphatase [Deltaproteobacteria bacterium HGW-Deltaproteobacteria-15]